MRYRAYGDRYGRLMVLMHNPYKSHPGAVYVDCRCDCGQFVVVRDTALFRKDTTSCGCDEQEKLAPKIRRYKLSTTLEHKTWVQLQAMCYNPAHPLYRKDREWCFHMGYRWAHSFEQFYNDMGPQPGPQYVVQRRNPKKPFENGNCFWALPGFHPEPA